MVKFRYELEVIENTPEAINEYHKVGWGGGEVEVTMSDIEALLNGKAVAHFDGEYTHVLTLKKGD